LFRSVVYAAAGGGDGRGPFGDLREPILFRGVGWPAGHCAQSDTVGAVGWGACDLRGAGAKGAPVDRADRVCCYVGVVGGRTAGIYQPERIFDRGAAGSYAAGGAPSAVGYEPARRQTKSRRVRYTADIYRQLSAVSDKDRLGDALRQ